MFEVVPQILERDRLIYQGNGEVAEKDTLVYAIRLDKVNDIEYFFTFSYLNHEQAAAICKKLWYEGRKFFQDVNRTPDPQWTLISSRNDCIE